MDIYPSYQTLTSEEADDLSRRPILPLPLSLVPTYKMPNFPSPKYEQFIKELPVDTTVDDFIQEKLVDFADAMDNR